MPVARLFELTKTVAFLPIILSLTAPVEIWTKYGPTACATRSEPTGTCRLHDSLLLTLAATFRRRHEKRSILALQARIMAGPIAKAALPSHRPIATGLQASKDRYGITHTRRPHPLAVLYRPVSSTAAASIRPLTTSCSSTATTRVPLYGRCHLIRTVRSPRTPNSIPIWAHLFT